VSEVSIAIRAAGVADAAAVASVGATSFRDAYSPHSDRADLESHIRSYFSAAAVRSEIEQQGRSYLLATVDAQPAGMAKYRDAPCPVPGGASAALEVQQLYVLASMQRHGLGRRLIQELLAIAHRRGADGIWLSCWEDADWAVSFYRKNGFSVVGTAPFELGTTRYRDFLMWLPQEAEKKPSHSPS
jgi:ribosomal protein S18 acetylase RimI-like enzyme